MARKAKGSGLESSTSRSELKHQKAIHRQRLQPGLSLGYYKPSQDVAGTWYAVGYDPAATPRESRQKLGFADDFSPADDEVILSWAQASEKARSWFKDQAHHTAQIKAGVIIHRGPYTVDMAWSDYIQSAIARGVRGVKIMQQGYEAQIGPVLGATEVEKLTKAQIKAWFEGVSLSPRRTNISEKTITKRAKAQAKLTAQPALLSPEELADQARARRNSANRIFTNLKAALNHALDVDRIKCSPVWHAVKPFKNTTSKRVRVLTSGERELLIDACDPDFKPLVIAALFTGARYGELTKVRVKDFDPIGRSLFIKFGKGKDGYVERHAHLTNEGTAWFSAFTAGRDSDERMFTRSKVERTKRAETLRGFDGWADYDQVYAMERAVKKAGIPKATFHELRHTYATSLLQAGCQLIHVADALGHKDTRMCERHYGHLARADHSAAIDKHAPKVLGYSWATISLHTTASDAHPETYSFDGSKTAGPVRA